MDNHPIYCDYNATTPMAPEVFSAMEPWLKSRFANPSSLHSLGKEAAKAVKQARRQIASFFQAEEEHEILLTSGGTESNNTAIRAALRMTGKRRLVTTSVEHSSIRKLAQQLVKEGYEVFELPVDSRGRLNLEDLKDALTEDTAVVSVMLANNETGVLFPVSEIGKIVRAAGILFHVDAVQAAGKYPISLKSLSADFVSVSAHKFYGPKGTGFLYVRKDAPFYPLITGGGQERGRRAGTENVAAVVGMAAACELASNGFQAEITRLASLRDLFENKITKAISGTVVSGFDVPRLPNTSNILFPGMDGEALLIKLDEQGVCASNGSACLSGSPEPSHVLIAMGYSDEEAGSAIRFSFGRYTSQEEIEKTADVLIQTVEKMRKFRETVSRR